MQVSLFTFILAGRKSASKMIPGSNHNKGTHYNPSTIGNIK